MARPIMVAVGGDSGTGKTTLARGLERVFGEDRVLSVCLDDYHALDRRQRTLVGFTALDPRANNFAAMEEDLWLLAEGQSVTKPVYDHHDGTFAERERVEPREIVIVQGLFPLYTRALRSLFDVTVWLDPAEDLKTGWKVQRDVLQRGYSAEQVRAEIAKRAPDVEAHIAPQAVHADLSVRFSQRSADTPPSQLDARIRKGGRFRPLDYREFASSSTHLRTLEVGAGPYPDTIIELDGDVDAETSARLQTLIWSSMGDHRGRVRPDLLGDFTARDGTHGMSHTLALAQLLIARRVCLVADQLSAAAAA